MFFLKILKLNQIKKQKNLFRKFLLHEEISVKKLPMIIAKISKKIITKLEKTKAGKNEIIMSLILYFLTERKLSQDEIEKNLDALGIICNLSTLINILEKEDFIEQNNNYYKLK